ncbi:hypothetical protein [Streptomyces anandii]|uniref:hypothetical protein n=1 Tax=Streptomyces anandii TaxID=285454 RepID=UPI0037AC7B34
MPDWHDAGCARDCSEQHTYHHGRCALAPEPQPTVKISSVSTAADGCPAICLDAYTPQELADLIEPALQRVTIRLGPNALAMLRRGEPVGLSGDEYADLARQAAHAIVHRHDPEPGTTAADNAELTANEARSLVDELGLDLYRAQDALEFVGECCDIADRRQQTITTTDVREWLKGARCGRQLAADAQPQLAALPVGGLVTGLDICELPSETLARCTGKTSCPAILRLADGDYLVIGARATDRDLGTELARHGARLGDDEAAVVIPAAVMNAAVLDVAGDALSRPVPGEHVYFSTGCLHGDTTVPDGRTGHEYCQSETAETGAKTPAQYKFCTPVCTCPCHATQKET